ncbi:hypothetical protein [Deinococcus ruber]|uniref:Uncharacterized protein n=1 Tax=Deinococcus ruber TaxID=1848197 RepID=A0A918CPA8_9DEIO|nr:hypothetical protein [Deinococcus ruber]GGR31694.1 hypothetical protein GCM10008957_47860 [Deinococcus ruber]
MNTTLPWIHPLKKALPLTLLTTLGPGMLGMAGAAISASIDQLGGRTATSVVRGDTAFPSVSLPAASVDITTRGSVDNRLVASIPNNRDVMVKLNHARNEAGTLFVYLQVDPAADRHAVHTQVPLTITNTLTGKSVTMNVQLNTLKR